MRSPIVALQGVFCAPQTTVRGGGPRKLKAVKASLTHALVAHLTKFTPAARGVVPRAPEFPEKKRQISYLVKCGVQVGFDFQLVNVSA